MRFLCQNHVNYLRIMFLLQPTVVGTATFDLLLSWILFLVLQPSIGKMVCVCVLCLHHFSVHYLPTFLSGFYEFFEHFMFVDHIHIPPQLFQISPSHPTFCLSSSFKTNLYCLNSLSAGTWWTYEWLHTLLEKTNPYSPTANYYQ